MGKSYGEYLKLDELLSLQEPITKTHDEMQFIIVHQASELWLKLLQNELRAVRAAMREGDAATADHLLSRSAVLLAQLMAAMDVVETMRPADFLLFRDELKPASGFQSLQFREIEILCGFRDERYLKGFDGADRERLEERFGEPTLFDAFLDLAARNGLLSKERDPVLGYLIEILRSAGSHPLYRVEEGLAAIDQGVALFRQRHLQMTMRMIGTRPGTGKESVSRMEDYGTMSEGGVSYLKTTLDRRFFPLLWEARTMVTR